MLPTDQPLQVNEVFYSVQGEGLHAGRPAWFIRLQGCNLTCHWCDTKDTWPIMSNPNSDYAVDDETLLRFLNPSKAYHVIVTGGEPTLQTRALTRFFALAKEREPSLRFHIETNGTRSPPENADWVTVSPKPGTSYRVCTDALNAADELKYIVDDTFQVSVVAKRFSGPVLLQPESGRKDAIAQILTILEDHPHWRLGLQVHKYLETT